MDLYLVTGNKNKLREAEHILGIKLKNIDIDLHEIQELDPEKIAEHKVKQAYNIVKQPLFVWDQSINIECLNGFPGPLIKWFWTRVTLKKICEIANFYKNNKVSASTVLTYYDGKTLKHFYGEIKGTIPDQPTGEKGWGWDPIFVPEGHDKTYAEFLPEEVVKLRSHRIAIERLKDFLNSSKN
ncbi:non-canonical purine NTP pyrophosphatase [Candidatus Woesearchaeota archaeon]|nr:non-canonical purine NTP pyrophosphatase [Candidatus Woesearchaeota archaeon]